MRRPLATALALLSFSLACATSDEAAVKALVRALDSQRDVRASLVQARSDGGQSITVSVQIVPRRGVRATIIQPFVYSGIVSFDNGDTWKNFDPHMNLVRIEKSPATFQLDISSREKLIRKNFETTFAGEAMIAGRSTKVVVMKGKFADMADRRLYIDAENSLILRYIVYQPDAAPVTTVDTKSIDLRTVLDSAEFEKIGEDGAKVVKSWGPLEVRQARDAEKHVGFVPQVPAALVAGLSKQAIHVVGTEERKFVGVRLTDGMAVVTVYLWKPKDGETSSQEPFKGSYDARAANGVRCKVVGEIADRVKSTLAASFARLYEGPSNLPGTRSLPRNVDPSIKPGEAKTPERPKLVIDHE